MDLFTKIKSITSFTESEEIFTQFILNHPYDVIQLSLQQLAKTSYVSISTIYRVMEKLDINGLNQLKLQISESLKNNKDLKEIIYVFLTIFLYLLKCPQILILSALRAFCFCGKPHISRSIFLYFRYQSWLKSW